MEIKEGKEFVKSISHKILDVNNSEETIKAAIDELNSYFLELIGKTERQEDLEHLAGMPSKAGTALSFNHAADCLLDYIRTTKFLRAYTEAIKDQQEKHPGETINIFYAGCGPLAPFMTLVAPLYTSEEVQFTLLEINDLSLMSTKKLIRKLGLNDYMKKFHSADAITFKIPNPEEIHILFSETLDSLLNRECYVPILWNLLPQLSEKTLVIPENVQIKLNLKVEEGEETFGQVVFDTRQALANTPKTEELPGNLAPTFFSLKNKDPYYSIILDTEVQIYGDYVLYRSESSISLALEIPIHKPITHKGVDFIYQFSPQPTLQMTMVEHDDA